MLKKVNEFKSLFRLNALKHYVSFVFLTLFVLNILNLMDSCWFVKSKRKSTLKFSSVKPYAGWFCFIEEGKEIYLEKVTLIDYGIQSVFDHINDFSSINLFLLRNTYSQHNTLFILVLFDFLYALLTW